MLPQFDIFKIHFAKTLN